MFLRTLLCLVLTGLAIAQTDAAPGADQADAATLTLSASEALREAVTSDGLRRHLEAFQAIADANGGNRSAGSAGYDASLAYVREQLEEAGYELATQDFRVGGFAVLAPPELSQLTPTTRLYANGADIAVMTFSGSGEVEAQLQAVDLNLPPGAAGSSTSGCEDADFSDFRVGSVALLQRGTCSFDSKVRRAETAGASGVIIFNEGQPGRTELFEGSLAGAAALPVLSASFATGEQLAEAEPTVRIVTQTRSSPSTTQNLIAQSVGGDPDTVIMLGAHLDSVPAGPGIHDNGSGSAAVLEIALQLAGLELETAPTFRFAWWGAEELGLRGSRHYADTLSSGDAGRIKAYINLDMIASPNFVRFVYDGDESERSAQLPLPEGSADLEHLFLEYFAQTSADTEAVAVFSRSDHAALATAGVPVAGLFTGAEGVKSPEEASVFGGAAGEAYDSCYHRACDTLDNIDFTVFEQMADAAAHVVFTLGSEGLEP